MNDNGRTRRLQVVAGSESLISSAGGSLLVQTAQVTGLSQALRVGLAPWRAARARHDPGKIVLDLAVSVALGGDCLADLGVVRAQPELFGAVASDPTVSRLIATLAGDGPAALAALRTARAAARERVWQLQPPVADDGPVVIDLDATIVLAHSEKEGATPTWKRTFGFHPLLAFLDHGGGGTGEPVGGLLRIGKATANDAADHIAVLTQALAQLPAEQRSRVLVRGDSGAGVHRFVQHVHDLGLRYSVGLYAHQPIIDALAALPRQAWRAAIDSDGQPRDGAQVAELTRYLRPARNPWPPGMRVIARRERPHPGAQLRLTDADGWRITIFATNVTGGRIAEHELLHRQRARAEDRIRCLKDTGLRNLPLHDFAANELWLELVALAADLLAWTQHLALTGTAARTWEPKRLRLRLLNIAGRVVRTGRRRLLRLPRGWPWADPLLAGNHRLSTFTA
ncbi:MAG: transposase family protein [Frankiales bacterium]|nr:transposase family protein [Frankiales bacterium]